MNNVTPIKKYEQCSCYQLLATECLQISSCLKFLTKKKIFTFCSTTYRIRKQTSHLMSVFVNILRKKGSLEAAQVLVGKFQFWIRSDKMSLLLFKPFKL